MGYHRYNWLKNRLFEGLSEEELDLVLKWVKEKSFSEGEVILREGELGKELHLIQEGQVEVLKLDAAEHRDYRINILQAGTVFGEMAFFGKNVRKATIRALSPTKTFEIFMGEIEVNHPEIALKILNNFAHHFAARLEETNQNAVLAAKKVLIKEHKLNEMSRLSLQIFIVLLLYQCTVSSFSYFTDLKAHNAFFFLEMPLILAISYFCYLLIKRSGAPLSTYGLTLHNWKKSVFESLLVSFALMILLIGVKWVAIHTLPSYADMPLFGLSVKRLGANPPTGMFGWWGSSKLTAVQLLSRASLILYILSTPLQEFIFRGVLLTSLQKTLHGRNRTRLAILISTLLFAAVHEPLFWLFPIAVFLPGLLWGWLFARHRTLIGVSISHLLLGFWAFYIIGFPYQ